MRVLISANMEGATGVTGWPEVTPGAPEWTHFRHLLTRDVNAAVEGAFAGGASDVVVNEAHWTMRNILMEELDSRAQLIRGSHKPLVMMQGLELCDVVFFVAYHAAAGEPGVLSHSETRDFVGVELNGQPCSEARINAAVAGERGIPIALVTGDDVVCAEAISLFPGVTTAVVKHAIDNFSARCLLPQAAQSLIREAAHAAVSNASALAPYRLDPPFEVTVTLREPAQAGVLANLPGVCRTGHRTVALSTATARDVYGAIEAMATLAEAVTRH